MTYMYTDEMQELDAKKIMHDKYSLQRENRRLKTAIRQAREHLFEAHVLLCRAYAEGGGGDAQ